MAGFTLLVYRLGLFVGSSLLVLLAVIQKTALGTSSKLPTRPDHFRWHHLRTKAQTWFTRLFAVSRLILSGLALLIGVLVWPVTAFAAPSVYCTTLNATVANGGSVSIDVSLCDGPPDGGMSGPIAPFAQHGTVTIGSNTGGTQFATYAHSGDSATSDQFFLEDNDSGVVTVNITIDPPASPITVSPGALPSMTAGTAFSQSLSATGGTAPYTYSLQSGSLPLGISLTSGGVLSGTPTQRGGYAFTVRATDDIGQFVDKGYTGTVLNPSISIAPTSATAVQGVSFSQTITASGGVGPYTFAVESGTLPAGISLSSSGLLSGTTSSAPGPYTLTLRVTDSSTGPGVYFELESFTLTVAAAPSVSISVSPASMSEDSAGNLVYTVTRSQNLSSSTIVNLGYTGSADASDYTGETLTVTIPSGSTSGIVVINPSADVTVEADETVIVSIQSGSGYTIGVPSSATGTILNDDLGTLTINNVTFPENDSGTQAISFTISLSQPAGPGGVTFDIATANGTATAGEDYQAKSIVGATIAPGESTYFFSVNVYGDTSNEPNEWFFVNITNVTNAILGDGQGVGTIVNDDPVPTITLAPASLSATTVGASYSETLTASGGTGPYTYAATAGVLPDGLTLTSSGVLSGTPTDEGTFNFTISATDSSGGTGPYSGSRAYTLTVAAPVIALSPATLPPATQGVPYAQTITASGGTAPYTYSTTAGALPSGINLSSSGVLSGSPTVNGTFNFTVTATDSSTGSGPYSDSRAYSFQISAVAPPVVGSVSVPANGYYRVGEVLSFTVNFNETVLVDTSGGSPGLPVVIGAATVDAIYVSGSGSNALVFQYVVNPGDLDLNGIQVGGAIGLNGGAIANVFGTPADLALNGVGSTTGVLVDTIAPTVTSSAVSGSPAPDAVAIDFLVTFSKPVNGVDSSDFVLTTTGSAMGTISGVATSDNVTYTVSVTGVSGIGSLRLDVLADGSITDTPGNPLAAAYAAGTLWVRSGSSNASLAGLAPSAGALDPAFDAATFDYAVAVANSVTNLTLTPTADNANATITVNGTTVASGSTSQPLALAVGATAIPVVVTAQDGTTTRTYTVTVTRASSAPTVMSRTVAINAGQTASVELTDGATGGPFTSAAMIDISDSSAGSAHIEQNGQSFLLVFASSPTFSGGADIRFTLSSVHGTSAPGTISFTVLARPDPTLDAEVLGLLRAQTDTAKRFARVQTGNFNGRLEQLHDEGDRRRNSLNVRLGYNENGQRGDQAARALNEAGADVPGLLGYASQSSGGAGNGGLATDKANGLGASDGRGMDLGPYAIWTGGFVDFSQSDKGGIDLDGTLVGVSAGIDYRFSDRFIAGFGVGFGRDHTYIGGNGTENTGLAYSAALYGSYKPANNFFIDGLIGASWLDFDSHRYVTATGDFATGSRSGQQVFGSLSAAYELRDETWLLSPYGRIEMSRTWLDGFAEEGGGAFGLRYGDQTIDTVSGVIGLRAEYAFKKSWGTLTPGARVEYTHDFAGSSRAHLGYIDLDHLPYWLDVEASNRSYVTLGLSLDAELPQAWTLGFDYRTAFGNARQDHTFGLKVGKRF